MSPLAKGSSDEVIGNNIAELMSSGARPQNQAVAIALKAAGKYTGPAKPKKAKKK